MLFYLFRKLPQMGVGLAFLLDTIARIQKDEDDRSGRQENGDDEKPAVFRSKPFRSAHVMEFE